MSFWLRLCRFENLPSITFVCLSIYELYAETTALSSSPCPLRSCCCEVMERAGSEFISGDSCDSCDSLLVPSKKSKPPQDSLKHKAANIYSHLDSILGNSRGLHPPPIPNTAGHKLLVGRYSTERERRKRWRWWPHSGRLARKPPLLIARGGGGPGLLRHWQWPIRHSRLPLSSIQRTSPLS